MCIIPVLHFLIGFMQFSIVFFFCFVLSSIFKFDSFDLFEHAHFRKMCTMSLVNSLAAVRNSFSLLRVQ